MRSIVRWAGSKRQILKKLRPHWSDAYRRYIEPFAGSACLFFDLQPRRAILADLNSELIRTYQALTNDVDQVIRHFSLMSSDSNTYYKVRAVNPDALSLPELAARFLYLNRNCFNGLYRTNMAGGFNVPYGPPKSAVLNFEQDVRSAAEMLRTAELEVADFEDTVSKARSGDFVYLDPPYMIQKRRVFREYLPRSFSASDLGRLGKCLQRIDENGAAFLISYADSPEARALLRPWRYQRVRVRRHISGFVDTRRVGFELLAYNRLLEDISDGN
ncbi:MAG: Dam family site-specific DNA-(adenine-N6)-methyltransferase [Thermoanaerobaculia bacterium]